MPTYILLTKLAPSAGDQLKKRDRTSHKWYKKVKEACQEVKFKSHYALLGQYDFLDIYDAPDEETATKISMISRMDGALYAETLIAMEHKKFIEIANKIG
jgi:uncharacterized protein with GYD domain